MASPNELIQELAKKETLAEDILTDKQLIIDSDRKRNTNREALTNIRKKLNNEKKLWINMGDMFIKLPKDDVKNMIEEDQKKLDEEIESRRDMVRQKAMKLDQLENGQQTSGFDLQGLKAADIYNIRNRKTQEREI
ncbi:p53 and DNA damage-regulated protein 1 [Umbelopsis sp. WA50703]